MSEPERLLDRDGLGATLLRSAARDEPGERSWQRALAATALAGAAATATGSGAAATALGAGFWLKWLAVGAVAGGLTALGAVAILDRGAPPASPARPVAVQAPEPAREPAALAVSSAEREPAPAVASAAPAGAKVTAREPAPSDSTERTDTLSRELARIDQARRKLARGDAAGAIGELDRYRAEFPRQAFAEEAALIRAEALAQEGRCSDALALAPPRDKSGALSRRWDALRLRCR